MTHVKTRQHALKLFPKRHLGAGGLSNLQHAMRRNVSTYQLNTDAIASMVEGKLIPSNPSIVDHHDIRSGGRDP